MTYFMDLNQVLIFLSLFPLKIKHIGCLVYLSAVTLQEYPPKKSVQVAPFWQGLGVHSSTCSSQ